MKRWSRLSLILEGCEIITKPSQKQQVAPETFPKEHLETLLVTESALWHFLLHRPCGEDSSFDHPLLCLTRITRNVLCVFFHMPIWLLLLEIACVLDTAVESLLLGSTSFNPLQSVWFSKNAKLLGKIQRCPTLPHLGQFIFLLPYFSNDQKKSGI